MDAYTISGTDPTVDWIRPVRGLTKFLRIMGLWPRIHGTPQEESQFCRLIGWFSYTMYAILFQLIFTVAYDFFKCINFLYLTDINIITRAMFICLTELSLAVKIGNFLLRMRTVQGFLGNIAHGIELRSAKESAQVSKALAFLRQVIVWFLATANTTGIFSYMSPVLVAEPMLPYPGWYPLDWPNNSRDYWIVWTYQVLGMFFQIQALVIIEVYFIYLMVVASAQLNVLAGRIQCIGHVIGGENVEVAEGIRRQRDRRAERTLVDCIKSHVIVMKFASSVEHTGSIPYFIQFVLSGIVLCVAVFQIAILNPTEAIAEFVFYVGFVMTMLTQIFLPCYFGNEIVLRSEQLQLAVYNSNWPDRSAGYRQLVLVYMEILRRPQKLVVGQLFSLTLDSFLSVLNRAYSMYAVVQSFAE